MLSFPFSFKIQFRQFYKSCLKNTRSRSQESLSFWLHNSSVHRAVVVESLNSPILIYPDRLTHYLPRITLTCCADTTSNFSGLRSSIHDYCICMLHREFFFFPFNPHRKEGAALPLCRWRREVQILEIWRTQPLSYLICCGIVCISLHLSLTPVAGWGLYIDIREGYRGFQTGLLTKWEANTQCDKLM